MDVKLCFDVREENRMRVFENEVPRKIIFQRLLQGGWDGHGNVAQTNDTEKYARNMVGTSEGKRLLEDLGVDGRVILRRMLGKRM
jgi:hypothetical protein